MKNPRILIVDDHEVVREGLKSLFAGERPDWEICGEASSGEQAIQQMQATNPNIVVLDISMPGMSGLEAAPKLRKLCPDCPILIFTTHDSAMLSDDVKHANAQGFVLKTQAFRDLIHAVEVLTSGGTFFGKTEDVEPKKPAPETGGQTLYAGLKRMWAIYFPKVTA